MDARNQAIVRGVLSAYVGLGPEEMTDGKRLGEDLRLDAVDLLLVCTRLSGLTPRGTSFPLRALAGAETIGHLVDAFSRWLDDEEDAVAPTLRSPPPHEEVEAPTSGIRRSIGTREVTP
jgi:hypothetical protein